MAASSPVGFSITAPHGVVERVLSPDRLGAVHQYGLYLTWRSDPSIQQRVDALGRPLCSAQATVAGTIYPDFALKQGKGENILEYHKQCLETIPLEDAPYIPDDVFRVQPVKKLRIALAAKYKKVPDAMVRPFVGDDRVEQAAGMLSARTEAERPYLHFMRTRDDEPTASVIREGIEIGAKLMRKALVQENMGYLGRLIHTTQDSFSAAHTNRTPPGTLGTLYGTVVEAYFFGNQTDHSHSRQESWRAVSRAGSPEAARLEWSVLACRALIIFFLNGMDKLAVLSTDSEEARKKFVDREIMPDFVALLRNSIFASDEILRGMMSRPVPVIQEGEEDEADDSSSDERETNEPSAAAAPGEMQDIGRRRGWGRRRRSGGGGAFLAGALAGGVLGAAVAPRPVVYAPPAYGVYDPYWDDPAYYRYWDPVRGRCVRTRVGAHRSRYAQGQERPRWKVQPTQERRAARACGQCARRRHPDCCAHPARGSGSARSLGAAHQGAFGPHRRTRDPSVAHERIARTARWL